MTDARLFCGPARRRGPLVWALGCVVASCLAPPAGAEDARDRTGAGWLVMVEACAALAETGRRSVFDGWDVATDGGGSCGGDPACEDDDMTFVAPAPSAAAAVTVRVGAADWVGERHHAGARPETTFGSDPAHVFCRSAQGSSPETAAIESAHADWIRRARAAGRLRPAEDYVSLPAGPYLGCGHDGRPYLIEFSLMRPGVAIVRMNHPTRARAPGGPGGPDGPVCAGMTS